MWFIIRALMISLLVPKQFLVERDNKEIAHLTSEVRFNFK